MKTLLAALSAALLSTVAADAATFKPIYKGISLVMTGDIVHGDRERLIDAYNGSCQRRGYCPERIFLNSEGGLLTVGWDLADLVVESGMHTVVGRTDECYSACFIVFAAGSRRVVFETSHIGVHGVSRWTGKPGSRERYVGESLDSTIQHGPAPPETLWCPGANSGEDDRHAVVGHIVPSRRGRWRLDTGAQIKDDSTTNALRAALVTNADRGILDWPWTRKNVLRWTRILTDERKIRTPADGIAAIDRWRETT